MKNLLDELKGLLSSDDRLVSEGKLMKNKIIELVFSLDPQLLKLLLSDVSIKKHFFTFVGDIVVFDKIKFQKFVSNKQFLPDSYTAYKNKIGLMSGETYIKERNDVVLVWAYKDCVLEGGQGEAEQVRKETFWNETISPEEIDRLLAPKVLVQWHACDGNGMAAATKIEQDSNLLIKGNNLIALHSLLKTKRERVKLIFIDPPFNTDNDSFQYNDSFTQSTWLTFLKNRLEVAKQLMSDDGSIFVHIDHDNNHPVKMLMDEIFGVENFRNEIVLPGRASKNLQKQFDSIKKFQVRHDILFWYSKNPNMSIKPYWVPKHDLGNEEGHWHHAWSTEERKTMQFELLGTKISKGQWVWGETRALKAVANYERYLAESGGRTLVEYWRDTGSELSFIRKSPDDGKPQYWRAPATTKLADTVWNGIPIYSSEHGFKTAKNEKYLAEIIKFASNEGDLVMDFFGGSGSTAATAHKLNRKWITVEQLDYVETMTRNRLLGVIKGDNGGISKEVKWSGGGSFLYCELAKANKLFVDQIEEATTDEALGQIWETMKAEAFLSYRVDPKKVDDTKSEFDELSMQDKKRLLIEVLDKNMLYIPLSELDDETNKLTPHEKELNKQFYKLG
jgi:adenine-specific DNA-methyltransferase